MSRFLADLSTFFQILTGPRLQMIALAVAAPVLTAMTCWLVYLVRFGWPVERAQQQLGILGWAVAGAMILLGLVVSAMTAGLIKGFKIQGPGGVSAEVETDDK